jgi:hypothetical protein
MGFNLAFKGLNTNGMKKNLCWPTDVRWLNKFNEQYGA